MNVPNLGKYASVCDLPYTTQKITYHRGYGNIVVHDVNGDNTVSTSITRFNRIEPLQLPFGSHLPPRVADSTYEMFNSQTTNAWADKRFFD
jgi:hypothetical protein